jgi:hypothetical protein
MSSQTNPQDSNGTKTSAVTAAMPAGTTTRHQPARPDRAARATAVSELDDAVRTLVGVHAVDEADGVLRA